MLQPEMALWRGSHARYDMLKCFDTTLDPVGVVINVLANNGQRFENVTLHCTHVQTVATMNVNKSLTRIDLHTATVHEHVLRERMASLHIGHYSQRPAF